jgi:HAD superfamily hydrolase (TIGR01509 family)
MKLVLLDLDGTLIQSTEVIMETFKITFDKFFKDVTLTDEVLTSFLGTTLFKTFELYMDETHDMDTLISFYRNTSEALIEDNLHAYPNAKELLSQLKEKGIKVGVVTSKMREVARYHLKLTGLVEYVDHIVGYEDVIHHKPDKEPLEKALAYFNVSKEDAIYVGDHENDIISAKNANMESCIVSFSHRLKEALSYQPEYVIDDLIHILDLI